MRWGIETSFRDLKHTIGLNYYHSKKSDSILQEIYSRMVMYNFSQLVTNRAKIKRPKSRRGRKFAYKINFSQFAQICRKFLRNKIKCRDVIELIEKYILPIRGGKDHPRTKSPRREIYFNFRLAWVSWNDIFWGSFMNYQPCCAMLQNTTHRFVKSFWENSTFCSSPFLSLMVLTYLPTSI